MIQKILDLHIHSKYSRACSKALELPVIAKACEERGIDIVVTGDFTHPAWFAHIKEWLVEEANGVYKLKDNSSKTRFILGTEVAVVKKDGDRTRRVHHLIFAPSIAVVEKFNQTLAERGFNLKADGRPILGLTSRQLLEICLEIDSRMQLIPAHAWTPWFGVFGSKGGYDSLEEAFGDLAPHIHAIETGLSSDPLMNWRCSFLDRISLVSNSDAHSPQKLGREANVLLFDEGEEITYDRLFSSINQKDPRSFPYTIEFYPEEGKYHIDGHADCRFSCAPEETRRLGGRCPTCGRPITVGVLSRVNDLADRSEDEAKKIAEEKGFSTYKSLVPLPEILADTFECGVGTNKVEEMYGVMIRELGAEFHILLNTAIGDIEKVAGKEVGEAIRRVRVGNVYVVPGYDGIFGVVKVFRDAKERGVPIQKGLF